MQHQDKKIKMIFAGDVMCGDSFYSIGSGVASSIDKFASDFLPLEIQKMFSKYDIALCNVECVLSDKGRNDRVLRTIHMRGRPQSAQYLAEWGFNITNLANNHVFEQGVDAAIDTEKQLEEAGIKTIGTGHKGSFGDGLDHVQIEIAGLKLAILGCCLRDEKYAYNGGGTEKDLIRKIGILKDYNDIIIVSMHWGNEFINRPSIIQRKLGRELINSGANIVIGHHPHVIQGIEEFNGGLIAYSLGNFIFDSILKDTSWAMLLEVEVLDKKITNWHCIPTKQDKWHRPQLVTGSIKSELDNEIKYRSSLLDKDISNVDYQKQYDSDVKELDKFARRNLRMHLLRRILKMNPIFWFQILYRPIQRRLGKW